MHELGTVIPDSPIGKPQVLGTVHTAGMSVELSIKF